MAQFQNVGANVTDSNIPADVMYALNNLASYRELNDGVRKTLIPSTQKWHRRTANQGRRR
jgi:hypothetical protein